MGNVSNLALAREARRPQESPSHGGKGFALLHRKVMELPFYTEPDAAHLWVHLVLKANYQPEIVLTDLGEVACGRGQFITGRNKLSTETGVTPERVQYLLRKFVKMGMISTESNRKFTLITVLKYEEYQANFLPADYPQLTSGNPHESKASGEVLPADYQQITTSNNITNKTLPNGSVSPSAAEKLPIRKSAISCEDVIAAYHEILPEAKSVRALTDKRRNAIKTFWRKAGVVTRQLDGHGFTMDDWRKYLTYVRDNCRWMFEERQNQQRGTVWHSKGFDYLLNDNVYLKVREGDHDDR